MTKLTQFPPEAKDIVLMRTGNGWVIRRPTEYGNHGNLPDVTMMMVARTAGELAQIVTDWAAAQDRE